MVLLNTDNQYWFVINWTVAVLPTTAFKIVFEVVVWLLERLSLINGIPVDCKETAFVPCSMLNLIGLE